MEPLEVTLSSLLAKNLAEQLVAANMMLNDSLESISLQMASNISSTLKDLWSNYDLYNYTSLNDTYENNATDVVILGGTKKEIEGWLERRKNKIFFI